MKKKPARLYPLRGVRLTVDLNDRLETLSARGVDVPQLMKEAIEWGVSRAESELEQTVEAAIDAAIQGPGQGTGGRSS